MVNHIELSKVDQAVCNDTISAWVYIARFTVGADIEYKIDGVFVSGGDNCSDGAFVNSPDNHYDASDCPYPFVADACPFVPVVIDGGACLDFRQLWIDYTSACC